MTKAQYLKALKKLGLTPAGKATAKALGLSVRQCIRLAQEDSKISPTVSRLLEMYLKFGLPETQNAVLACFDP